MWNRTVTLSLCLFPSVAAQFSEFGTGCRRPIGRGLGAGTYAQALNPEAQLSDNWAVSAGRRYAIELVPERAMHVTGFSLFGRTTSGTRFVRAELYRGDGPGGAPKTILRSGQMEVRDTSSWNRVNFEQYALAKGQRYWVAFQIPTSPNVLFRVRYGASANHFMRHPTGGWTGPFRSLKFGYRIHTDPEAGRNVSTLVNTTTAFTVRSTLAFEDEAKSDLWLDGVSFLCRMRTGTARVETAIWSRNESGRPGNVLRQGTFDATNATGWRRAEFDSLFVPKGTRFFVTIRVPSLDFLVEAGLGAMEDVTYRWRLPDQVIWRGPATRRFAYKLHSALQHQNGGVTRTRTATSGRNVEFAHRVVAQRTQWIDGFSFTSAMTTQPAYVSCRMWLDDGGRPGRMVRDGQMHVSTRSRSNHATWRPWLVQRGEVFYIGFRTPDHATNRMRTVAETGTRGTYHYRTGSSAWSTAVTYLPFAWRIQGRAGAPRLAYAGSHEVGNRIRIVLGGATPNRAWGLILGVSKRRWLSAALPLSLPFRDCQLNVSFDLLLRAGSTGTSGGTVATMIVPNDRSLAGLQFHNQFFVVEDTAPLDMTWSNGGSVVLTASK